MEGETGAIRESAAGASQYQNNSEFKFRVFCPEGQKCRKMHFFVFALTYRGPGAPPNVKVGMPDDI